MVKLFVGNLGSNVGVSDLKRLFEKYGKVSECDIIRNYGFIHMNNEEEAKKACASLNNHVLDGKAIHLEFSTSKLRKAPGMDEVCFRCGEKSHKTNNCPLHDMTKDFKGYNLKRQSTLDDSPYPPPKRVECYFTPSREAATSGMAYEYMKSAAAASMAPRTNEPPIDSLLPRPLDRNLSPLYDDYLVARERYYFLRERLSSATSGNRGVATAAAPTLLAPQPQQMAPPPQQQPQQQQQLAPTVVYTTQYAQQPQQQPQQTQAVTYDYYAAAAAAPTAARTSPSAQRYPDVYYARTANGYEAVTLPRTTYQVAAAPAQQHPPDVYYHRTETGYEAFTVPATVGTAPTFVM